MEKTVDVSSFPLIAERASVLKNLCTEPFGDLNYSKSGIKQMRTLHSPRLPFQITVPNDTLHSPANSLDTQVSHVSVAADLKRNFIIGVLFFL